MTQKKPYENLLRSIPTKWAIALIAALIGYALLQPVLNARLGWSLLPLHRSPVRKSQRRLPRKHRAKILAICRRNRPNRIPKLRLARPRMPIRRPTIKRLAKSRLPRRNLLRNPQQTRSMDCWNRSGAIVISRPLLSVWPWKRRRTSTEACRATFEDQPNRPGKHGVFDGEWRLSYDGLT